MKIYQGTTVGVAKELRDPDVICSWENIVGRLRGEVNRVSPNEDHSEPSWNRQGESASREVTELTQEDTDIKTAGQNIPEHLVKV